MSSSKASYQPLRQFPSPPTHSEFQDEPTPHHHHHHQHSSPSPSRPTQSYWRARRSCVRSRLRLAPLCLLLALAPLFLYMRYLHTLIFIDYSVFPVRTGNINLDSGTDPELGLPPVRLNSTSNTSASAADLEALIVDARAALRTRFQSVWVPPSTLACPLSATASRRYAARFLDPDGRPNGRHRVMVALNLHASQAVLGAIGDAIVGLVRYLGPGNVFVSVYENGSWDHTGEGLGQLGAVLTGMGVGHRIRSSPKPTIWKGVDRISQLAAYRNEALRGFGPAEAGLGGVTEVVFVNDVFLCTQDILELVLQRALQGAAASCGTDWRASDSYLDRLGQRRSPGVVFYDSWVSRSLSGRTLRPRLDALTEWRDGYGVLFEHEEGALGELLRYRVKKALPVPVYSCWNGIIALDPTPFRAPSNIKFRSAMRKTGECAASECQLLAKDYWTLGFQKWILVPRVSVSYSEEVYHSKSLENGSKRTFEENEMEIGGDQGKEGDELIDWKLFEKPKSVVCWPDMYTFHIDFEWNHVLESPYNLEILKKNHLVGDQKMILNSTF